MQLLTARFGGHCDLARGRFFAAADQDRVTIEPQRRQPARIDVGQARRKLYVLRPQDRFFHARGQQHAHLLRIPIIGIDQQHSTRVIRQCAQQQIVQPRADGVTVNRYLLTDQTIDQLLHAAVGNQPSGAHAVTDIGDCATTSCGRVREAFSGRLERQFQIGRAQGNARSQLRERLLHFRGAGSDEFFGEFNRLQVDGHDLDMIVRAQAAQERLQIAQRFVTKFARLAGGRVEHHQHILGGCRRSGNIRRQADRKVCLSTGFDESQRLSRKGDC